MEKQEKVKLSKFIALILRHNPGAVGIELDKEGWCDVDTLATRINAKGWSFPITRQHILDIVATDMKKRYTVKDGKIRASQGHSVDGVDITFVEVKPPEYLYHGTSREAIEPILDQGLLPMQRHYVHLHPTVQETIIVGKRRDREPVILKILATTAYQDGIKFFVSENNVFLVDHMPPKYIEVLQDKKS